MEKAFCRIWEVSREIVENGKGYDIIETLVAINPDGSVYQTTRPFSNNIIAKGSEWKRVESDNVEEYVSGLEFIGNYPVIH